MTVSALGNLTIGQCVPLAAEAQLSLDASIGLVLPSLQARLAGLLALQARLETAPPSLSASLDIASKLVSALQLAIELNLPTVNLQLQAVVALIAQIELDLGTLTGHLAVSSRLALALGAGGMHAFAYGGAASQFGSELHAAIGGGLSTSGPSTPINAIVLATDLPATWQAAQTMFKTAP